MQAWLEEREEEARRPSAVLLKIARANDWQTLKSLPVTLRVSWSDGWFSAAAYQLNEAAFGDTLAEAVNGAAEMLCRVLGAPLEIAPDMNLALELDASAAERVRAG
ncbi:hypothetical protein ACFYT4_27090 [Streptomyces sp. NPDC004609]|uniref:hypothetical protein n=1 Tax=Streptomyces sp. NPDC004609 TaxID=3364704 RepID=UPI00368A4BAF